MSRVRIYEIQSDTRLRFIERRINRELKSLNLDKLTIRLFRSREGRVGYSLKNIPANAGRQVLDRVYAIVSDALGTKRGRPRKEPTHQVKCRVPESLYRSLVREAKRRKTTPSGLLGELAAQHVG
jgi:hypothetical protein